MTEPKPAIDPAPAAAPAQPRVLRSGESAEPLPGEGRPPILPNLGKVIGYSLLSITLAVGVALVGDFKIESIGSALIGGVFVVMVVGSSGVNGFWNPKDSRGEPLKRFASLDQAVKRASGRCAPRTSPRKARSDSLVCEQS